MDNQRREVHVEQDEARAGSTPHIVRYVLLISLALVIVALTVVWVTGAMSTSHSGSAYEDTQRAVAEEERRVEQ
ncbi:hypothetical protein [Novosphingobium sp. M1R2S20]|uniref:Uncharacterized protein n=1 Tax=Novosphingobium rhizovicinum TaxID=3228928 RepID=A0ABV3RC93_9SPHN